ncbi:hypothetical protein [Campylobacter gastrosuis]|uniref:Uncharacterized protein n=1 Tax=Campylobacter gastrosuis TaxID=2974576 RepID=A0ABT7HRT7_9BACT|nr:hypothetical protein [Campylobacter gastrosuis]MDL0089447.1 hypothetical protein [Campylobacter gastrosuis]
MKKIRNGSGLNSTLAYVNGKQSGQSNNYKVSGYSAGLNYKIPQVKGLNTSLTYTQVKKEYEKARGIRLGDERSEKEVWLKAVYKFTI